MKKLVSFCLLIFSAFSCFSQHSQVTVSDDFKIADKEYQDQTVSHSVYYNNSFYTATNSGIGGNYKWAFTKLYDLKYAVTISMFDKNMNKLKEVSLGNGEKLYGPLPPKLILLNDKLCLAYFQSDNKTSFNLYLSLIDETSLTLKEPKKICTIEQENVGIFKMESVINAGIVFIANSPDKTKTLVACNASPTAMQTFIIDNNLNILKQSTLKTTTGGFNISTAVLTNDNLECYVLKSEEETKIVCNSADGKKAETRLNPAGELIPSRTGATVSRDGKSIYVYSTAAGEKDDVTCSGLLLSQLDCSSMKLSKALAYQFDQEFLEKIFQKGGGDKHKKEFFMYNFSPNLVELESGNLAILGCPQMISTSTSMSAPNMNNQQHMVSTTTLDVGAVIAFYPNKNGKTFEYAVVPRRISVTKMASSGSGAIQVVQSPGINRSYSSFAAANRGDEIAIIYNDNEENLKKGEDEKLSKSDSPKDLVLAEALINKDMKLQYRQQIEKNLGGRYTYYLGNTVPNSASMLIFPIGKDGQGFNSRKTFFTNWCFLGMK